MTTQYDATVDGKDAKVRRDEPDPQVPVYDLSIENLCSLLANKRRQLREQNDVVDEEKKKQKTLEAQYAEIVDELRKRGEDVTTGQTSFFDRPRQTYPAANGSARVVEEPPIEQPGETRLALPGPPREHGDYERIPQEDEPARCICGAFMDSPAVQHDQAHAVYAASIVGDLAPNAGAAVQVEDAPVEFLPGVPRVKCTGKTCGAEMIFVLSTNGRPVPIDARPIADGKYAIAGADAKGTPKLRKAVDGDAVRVDSHFAHCPDARNFGNGARASDPDKKRSR